MTHEGRSERSLTAEQLARERALRAAVLIDAVRCVVGFAGHRERRSRQNAVRWILSRDTRSPFSFHNVCEALGFEASRIRRLLLGPALGLESDTRVKLAVTSGGRTVRRPRRDQARYVVLQGGRSA